MHAWSPTRDPLQPSRVTAAVTGHVDVASPTSHPMLPCPPDAAPCLFRSRDTLLSEQGAKALGAYTLHDVASRAPLDFTLLFSSVYSFGGKGLAGYAAANAALNGHAASCTHRGLAVGGLLLPPVRRVGLAERALGEV